jgi:lycopene beta-cyclase
VLKKYDFIFAGGGAAGLSLAYHLMRSSQRDRSMLIVDRDPKTTNDRTWCFWSRRPTHFSDIYYRSWQKIGLTTENSQVELEIAPYRYNMIRGLDFYQFTHSELEVRPNIDFITASIDQVIDAPGSVLISAGGTTYEADWLFDSRFRLEDVQKNPLRYHYLQQHFLGWEIETSQDVFDPSLPILFDFRTPQQGNMRFIYILPFDTRHALVEYTLFSADLLPQAEYENALKKYLTDTLHLRDYSIFAVEKASIPMTDHPLPRRNGPRILNIGTRGGRVKPSSGYAFLRIQNDSAAIVRSLEKFGHPFSIPTPPSRYRLFDSIFLNILQRRGDLGLKVFTQLFLKNPVQRIFSFLDESGDLLDNLRLIATMPTQPFLAAWLKLKLLRRI